MRKINHLGHSFVVKKLPLMSVPNVKKGIKKMIKEKVILQNETGLHARPAGELAKLATTFNCNINLNVNGKTVNAKSILGIMSLGIKASTEIEIECDGEDEEIAMAEILKAFENKFGE